MAPTLLATARRCTSWQLGALTSSQQNQFHGTRYWRGVAVKGARRVCGTFAVELLRPNQPPRPSAAPAGGSICAKGPSYMLLRAVGAFCSACAVQQSPKHYALARHALPQLYTPKAIVSHMEGTLVGVCAKVDGAGCTGQRAACMLPQLLNPAPIPQTPTLQSSS
jgi:hypothetical protein